MFELDALVNESALMRAITISAHGGTYISCASQKRTYHSSSRDFRTELSARGDLEPLLR